MKSLAKNNSELLPILILVVACLIIGLITIRDYGESWDEAGIYSYGKYAVTGYHDFWQPERLAEQDGFLSFYGPAYYIVLTLFASAATAIYPAWSGPIVWHFLYFLTFLICIPLLYFFVRRWVSPYASLATCMLFVSQPLLWGHAFINPKDLPFMTFFLASIFLGFEMVDRYFSPQPNYLLVAGAAFMLGMTISFRPIGPLAGLLVGIYALSKSPRKSPLLIVSYALLSFTTSYLSWPFLWGAPILRFMQSIKLMSKFPYPTKVLFMGHFYQGNDLPWFYYPVLLCIQLTEPTIPLVIVGLGLAVRRFIRSDNEKARGPLLLFIGWFLLPAVFISASGSTLYDNARQLFFLLPPVFLLISLSLDALINLFHSRWLIVGIIFLLMIPGIYASYKLHPYEYVYYNRFVTATGGTYSQYEMDYWGTSYREVALWLNSHAAANSTIWVTGPAHLLEVYLRPDLKLSCASEIDCGLHYDYVVALTRWKDERSCRAANTVFSIIRNHTVLSVVKQLALGENCK